MTEILSQMYKVILMCGVLKVEAAKIQKSCAFLKRDYRALPARKMLHPWCGTPTFLAVQHTTMCLDIKAGAFNVCINFLVNFYSQIFDYAM